MASVNRAKALMKMPKLFNTFSHKLMSVSLKSAITADPYFINQKSIKYPVPPIDSFDPRSHKDVPDSVMFNWFYYHMKNKKISNKDDLHPILAVPLDQAACGSCWAYATSYMFTCRIRMALLKRYKTQACLMSPFFQHIDICTGESSVESDSGGVTNKQNSSMAGEEAKNRISAYFTAAFAPKPLDPSPESCINHPDVDQCSQRKCIDALASYTNNKRNIYDITKDDPSLHQLCLGCGGNFVALALTMFAGHKDDKTKGAAKISDFTIYDWACMFGSPEVRKQFCRQDHKQINADKIIKYKADRYSYIVSPSEEVIRSEILNYGPVAVGYTVYNSFFTFFSQSGNAKKVYTENIANSDTDIKGGHAVCIIGYGEQDDGDGPVKYWLVANSWGNKWGDDGFFKIERGKNLCGMEDAIGGVYFAPDPNVEEAATLFPEYANSKYTNMMPDYLDHKNYTSCPHPSDDISHLKEINEKCRKCLPSKGKCLLPDLCPDGKSYDSNEGKCIKHPLGVHRGFVDIESVVHKKSSSGLIILAVLIIIGLIIYKKQRS